jgi:hypothetical protein
MKRSVLVGMALLASSCSAPEDALVSRCSTAMLSLSTECEVSAVRLVQPRSSYLDGNTKNFKIRLSGTFSVQKGRVDVAIPGCVEGGRAEVTPEQTASLSCDVVLNRSTFRFEVAATPREGGAEGFTGRLTFKPI